MKIFKITKVVSALAAAALLFSTGCSNELDNADTSFFGASKKYGSLEINTAARLIDVSQITSADVTVSGYGMTDIVKSGVSVTAGKGSVKINNIPVGKNRVVTVSSNVDGAVLRAVTDIAEGGNSISVNWASTALGNVFYNLIKANVNVSAYTDAKKTEIQTLIPNVHAALVDAELLASDVKAGTTGSSSKYKLQSGTVKVTASGVSGYSYQITDAVSNKVTVSSSSSSETLECAPGQHKILVMDENGVVASKEVLVGEGTETTVSITEGSGYDFTGKTIVFVKANSAPTIWAWEPDGADLSTLLGGDWNKSSAATLMTAVTSEYMAEPSGWYMMDYTSVATGKTIKFKLNFGGSEITGKAGTFWYNGSSSTSENPSPVADGISISVVNPAIVVKPTVSISPSNGEISLGQNIVVTLSDGNGTISSATVTAGSKTYSYSDFTNNVLTLKVSDVVSDAGNFTVTASAANEKGTGTASASLTAVASSNIKIYVSSTSGAPTIWAYTSSVSNITNAAKWPGEQMSAATGLTCNTNWYVITTTVEDTNGKTISFHLNSGSAIASTKTGTFWYDAAGIGGTCEAGKYYDADPSIKPDPVAPTLKITPASGKEIGTTGSIKIEADFGYDDITANSVTINGTKKTLVEGVNTFPVSDYATEAGKTITVSATLKNSKGTATVSATYTTKILAEDPFCWENVNCYFVLTDRFYNGDSKNDHSYYRQNAGNNSTCASGYNNTATFHGGDIAGLTAKMDYFKKLGVNAIWITAPYEQAHGWVTSGGNGFPHYAFHGYYTQDWTYMDQNMGTIEEFRAFVQKCHENGIRVIMDIVMNHTAYNTVEDMMTYKFGHYSGLTMSHGWLANAGKWTANPNSVEGSGYTYDSSYWDGDNWENWWGKWIRSFNYSSCLTGNSDYDRCGNSGLPDVRSEMEGNVTIPEFLHTKWTQEPDSKVVPTDTGNTCGNTYGDYKLPSVSNVDWLSVKGDWRTDNMGCPVEYQIAWLSAWVREFGVDGFRCDTAKHVQPKYWGMLKDACEAALEAWRGDSTKIDNSGAKDWDEGFWMTGECFTYFNIEGGRADGNYFNTGKFDSMINFKYNKEQSGSTTSSYPSTQDWTDFANTFAANKDTDGNGNYDNALTYLSSHDTALCRGSNQAEVGTMFGLLPGGIQIFYGDETNRPQAYTDCGDTDMMTRGDFNWSAANGELANHWGKVCTFRKYNPAVGAGSLVGGSAYKRSYSGRAGESKVAISISGTTVDVSGLFADGTTVYNWYDCSSATVSGGKVTFEGGTTNEPILVSDKNPAKFGVAY